ncbi:MAG TPA: sugar ABC transporter permease [Candidatus Onthovivens sp.]|nr:sugar ABC transporter permease [Candidatus Onthovivens sp.]
MKQPQLGAKFKRNISNTVIYIILIIVAVFWLFPFVYLFIQSVRSGSGVSLEFWPKGETFSFQHYIALFTDPKYEFWRWYGNTFFISIVTAAIQTVITLMVSYTLSRLRFKGRRALMKMMLIIGMFPGFLGMICIYRILRELNLSTSVFGLILVYISGSAMGYYISKGFFDTIPKSLDEAAMIDGASRNVIFWKIILPLAKPIVIYTILTSVIGPWGDFMMASYLIGRSAQENWTVAIGLQQWLTPTNSGFYFTRFCAAAIVVSIPIVLLFFFMQKYYVEGVTGGAVKG